MVGYDRKTGFDVAADVALLRELGLTGDATLVDLGAGTELLAAAIARFAGRVVAVDPSPAMLDAARARGSFETVEAGFLTYEHKGDPPAYVYTRNALHHLPDFWKAVALARVRDLLAAGHVRTEHSTFSWLLEPMLEHAGFEIRDGWYSESRTYARYVCVKR